MRRRRSGVALAIAPADADVLHRRAVDPVSPRAARQARALLALAAGQTAGAVARAEGVSTGTIGVWRRAYRAAGAASFVGPTPDWGTDALRRLASEPADPATARRARVLLAVAAGVSLAEAAAAEGVATKSVQYWRTAFRKAGVAGVRGSPPEDADEAPAAAVRRTRPRR